MREQTGLDVQCLALETPRQFGYFSGLVILGPSTRPNGRLEPADVQNMIAERRRCCRRFAGGSRKYRIGLDYP
ncbi:MAG: hypothetical protein WBP81_04795 [Solirubrobacteraceae bacterium]